MQMIASNWIDIKDIKPMGSVRMTVRGKFVKGNAQRYLAYKQELGLKAKKHFKEPSKNIIAVDVIFFMPIPASESKKKKASLLGQPHRKKPDIDNIIKGLFDSLNGIAWIDDNQVYSVNAKKIYAEKEGISFRVVELV